MTETYIVRVKDRIFSFVIMVFLCVAAVVFRDSAVFVAALLFVALLVILSFIGTRITIGEGYLTSRVIGIPTRISTSSIVSVRKINRNLSVFYREGEIIKAFVIKSIHSFRHSEDLIANLQGLATNDKNVSEQDLTQIYLKKIYRTIGSLEKHSASEEKSE